MPLKLRDNELHPAPVPDDSAIALEDFLNGASEDVTAVELTPEDDVNRLADSIDSLLRIDVSYPTYTDGRGHSHAHVLRTQYGYTGEIRAVGDVREDQILMMIRCGFDSFAFEDSRRENAARIHSMQPLLLESGRVYQPDYR